MNRHDAILALIASIYQSALDPADWIVTLESLAKLFGGHAAFTMTVGAALMKAPVSLVITYRSKRLWRMGTTITSMTCGVRPGSVKV